MPKYRFTWNETIVYETTIKADNLEAAKQLFEDGEFTRCSEIDRHHDSEFDVEEED